MTKVFCKNSLRLQIIGSFAEKLHHVSLRGFQVHLCSYMFFMHCFSCNVSLLHSFNGKPIFKYIYLPKLVSTEQFWSIIYKNTLLAEIMSQYKLGFLKFIIHRPYVFFSLQSFSLYQENN